jgi:hypothetical protein
MSHDIVPYPDETADTWTAVEICSVLAGPERMDDDDWRLSTMVAVVLGESAGMPRVLGKVIYSPGNLSHYSWAIGMFQLLRTWHVERAAMPGWELLTDRECMTPDIAAARAFQMMETNQIGWSYNMDWWDAFKNGAFRQYIATAMDAQDAYRVAAGKDPLPR